jgi:hypothetical protein
MIGVLASAGLVRNSAVQEQLVEDGKRMLAALAEKAREMPAYAQYGSALDTALVAIYADISNAKVRDALDQSCTQIPIPACCMGAPQPQ